ncbi:uncharacterized protein LOC112905519, partial [Agrilus planipennis]|uniref:Uncharacterized protein LOC112905519 n=1 Tax=Agrilus planipennis TaxID=224129 RepID=A0A7F5RD28_AGRPL
MLQNLTEEILKRPETNAFLNDSSLNFDVVLAEFVPPAFFYLSEKFKCPLIQMTSMPAHIITLNNIGNPNHLLETVDGNLPFGRKLNVFEKVVNAVYTFLFNAQVQGILYPLQAELVKKYLSHGEDVDLAALEKDKTSLVISNVVPGITEVHAKVPALIEVNGLHLTPPKPLPEDEVPSNGLILWKGITTMLQNLTEEILKRPETNAFLNDSSLNFDVVLAEFVPPAFFYLSEKFKCPLIQMTSMPAHIITLNNIGNPNHLLETVDGNLPFGRKLNVFEKVVNAVYTFLFNAQVQGILYPLQAELVKKYLSHGEDVDLAALEKDKTSLVISNVVPGITEVHAKVPALIEVNGLHLTPPKPLPE